jgi:hypothetical protein
MIVIREQVGKIITDCFLMIWNFTPAKLSHYVVIPGERLATP